MAALLTLAELQAFIHAAQALNFRQAADASCISQPALTRRIQSAEHKLGMPLLVRSTRHVALTEQGRALLPIARRLVSDYHGALAELGEFVAGVRGKVAVACLPSLAARLLPQTLQRHQAQRPHVKLTFDLLDRAGVLQRLVAGEADFGLCSAPPEGYDMLFEPLPLQDELLLLCASGDPLGAQPCVPWSAVHDRPYLSIGTISSTAPLIAQALQQRGIEVDAAYIVPDTAVLGRLVARGLGVAIVSRLALGLMDMGDLRAVPLAGPAVMRSCGVLRLRRRPLSTAAADFLAQLRGACLA